MRSYSLYFDLNIWFRVRKVTGTFEKRAPAPKFCVNYSRFSHQERDASQWTHRRLEFVVLYSTLLAVEITYCFSLSTTRHFLSTFARTGVNGRLKNLANMVLKINKKQPFIFYTLVYHRRDIKRLRIWSETCSTFWHHFLRSIYKSTDDRKLLFIFSIASLKR